MTLDNTRDPYWDGFTDEEMRQIGCLWHAVETDSELDELRSMFGRLDRDQRHELARQARACHWNPQLMELLVALRTVTAHPEPPAPSCGSTHPVATADGARHDVVDIDPAGCMCLQFVRDHVCAGVFAWRLWQAGSKKEAQA